MAKKGFIKISSEGVIKSANKKKNCIDLRFDKLNFSSGQFENLSAWIDSEESVRITLEQVQGTFETEKSQQG